MAYFAAFLYTYNYFFCIFFSVTLQCLYGSIHSACYRLLYTHLCACNCVEGYPVYGNALLYCCDARQRLRAGSAAATVRQWKQNPAVITQNRLTVCITVYVEYTLFIYVFSYL